MTEKLPAASVGPAFRIDGQMSDALGRDVLRLDVEETTSGLKTLRARLRGLPLEGGGARNPYPYLDGSVLDFGKVVDVSLGLPGSERTVFKGTVSGIEAEFEAGEEPSVGFFAEDQLMRLRMTRRMKTYENMTDADIAEEVARAHSIQAESDADGPTYDLVQQWNQSDLAFLRERAARIQAEVWIQDDKLCFKTRSRRTGTDIQLVQGGALVAISLRADLAHQRTEVKVSGYDAKERDVIEESAGEEVLLAETTGGRTGPAVLQRALGERVSHLVRAVPLNDGEARDWARAEMLRRGRGFVTVQGTTRGTPDMVVGSRVALEGVGPPFEGGGYYVTRIHHSWDRTPHQGFHTRFEAERSTLNEGAR